MQNYAVETATIHTLVLRRSLAMAVDGIWTVADAGRRDCLKVHIQTL